MQTEVFQNIFENKYQNLNRFESCVIAYLENHPATLGEDEWITDTNVDVRL